MPVNCWEHKKCGREPGGRAVTDLGICPAAQDRTFDGINSGQQAGRMCWALAGTFCGAQVQGSFAYKVTACLECEFFERVRSEQGESFTFLIPGHELEEVSNILSLVKHQQLTILELATPIIPIFDRIIAIPLIGMVDTTRSRELMRALLAGIRQYRARVVILDVTGVPLVDTAVANHLHKTIVAAKLKGVDTIVTGISDAVAETIVDLGVDWSGVRTMADLRSGLMEALRALGLRLVADAVIGSRAATVNGAAAP